MKPKSLLFDEGMCPAVCVCVMTVGGGDIIIRESKPYDTRLC